MKRIFIIRLSLVVLIFLVFAPLLMGQRRSTQILRGRVLDDSGKPVANATITMRSLAIPTDPSELYQKKFKSTVKTDKNGNWVMFALGDGWCLVEASAPGFDPHLIKVKVSQILPNPYMRFTLKKGRRLVRIGENEEFNRSVERANKIYEEEKYDEAIAFYERCLVENPSEYKIHYYIGNCYLEMKEFKRALEEYDKVLQKIPQEKSSETAETQAEALCRLGEIFAKRKNKEAALKYFMRSLELDPQNETYAYNVGDVCFSLRRIEEAIHHFTLASEIKPSWPEPYMKLGYVYLHKADYPKAKENFVKFLELAPDHPQSESIKEILEKLKE